MEYKYHELQTQGLTHQQIVLLMGLFYAMEESILFVLELKKEMV